MKYDEPYIVAELNSSHNGSIEKALEMINVAKECGCNAVKFQSWSPESLYCEEYYEKNPLSKRMVSKFALSSESLLILSEHCNKIGIDFSSTPYSNDEVDFLVEECDVPFIKIASMDINNIPFLQYIAKKQRRIVLSTGMATFDEIDRAVNVIKKEGCNKICVLHCVSEYPAKEEDINLNNIVMLKEHFPDCSVGYSDHTIGVEAACGAVALGAKYIEKHFTLDNKKIGWDNQMATEPPQMKELVEACRKMTVLLGSYERKVSQGELEQRDKMRRSIVPLRDLNVGDIITEADITAKRPGGGVPVDRQGDILGRTVKRSIKKDHVIHDEDLE